MTIVLKSSDDRPRLLRLSVESEAVGWGERWPRLDFAARVAPEFLGGEAVGAQDTRAEDGASVSLLVLPGEAREARLEFEAVLDGEARPGDYVFDVVATDESDGSRGTSSGLLRLRHSESWLLQYLPTIYQEANREARRNSAEYEPPPFFERFLRGFEEAMDPTQQLLAGMADIFGARSTPPEFVAWLATWVALALDENWPELKRRRLIREAVELYRWRGTRRGLSRYLEIYAGVSPQIDDQPFEGMRLGEATLLGRDTTLGNVPPHTFVVTLGVPEPDRLNAQIIHDIIRAEKPAHTAYELRIVRRVAEDE